MTDKLVHTLVTECMAHEVITIGPYDTLASAWDLMQAHGIRRLPVVHKDELTGILTLSDLLNAKPADPARRMGLAEVAAVLDDLVVSTAMSADPISVFDSDTVGHAAELMLEHKIGGLPVVDGRRKLVGLVTESNLFRLLAERWRSDNLIFSGAH
ncbi:MAG: CBS domain-containing protein [Gammaproteobacteria bacterium]